MNGLLNNLSQEEIKSVDFQVAALIALSEKDFYEFVKRAWREICSANFVDGYHIKAVCDHLQAVYNKQIRKLIINIPPRCAKSSLTTILFPAWCWITSPKTQFLTGSYDLALAGKHTLASRNLVLSDWYQDIWGDRFTLKDDQNQKTYYENNKHGSRKAFSVGGNITGFDADIIILDDPLNVEENVSQDKINKANNFISNTLMTRMNNPAESAFVLIMQRLQQNDPTEYLLGLDEGYEYLNLPMEYDQKRACKTSIFADPRKTEGELLDKVRFNDETIKQIKKRMGDDYDGQYQQNPIKKRGNIIDVVGFGTYNQKDLPKFKKIIQTWDTAWKEGQRNDYSAGVTIGMTQSHYYVLDVINKRLNTPDLKLIMQEYSDKWNPSVVLIEDISGGSVIIQELENETRLNIVPVNVRKIGNKETRAKAASPAVSCGKVLIPEAAPWLVDFIDQIKHFPRGTHDDMVDSFCMGINYLRQKKATFGWSR